MQKRIFTLSLWIVLILFDVLIVSGICETWVRFFIPVANLSYYHDAKLGDMLTPNQKTCGYVEGNYSNDFFSNSYGFHDIDRNTNKKQDTYRIQIYGDSLVAGAGVQIEDTIPSVTEKYLNKNKDIAANFEVMNMASGEDSTSAQFLVYKNIGTNFHPDLVICYFMADFPDNILETHHRTRSPYHSLNKSGELEDILPVPVNLATPFERFKRSSLLYRLFANKLLASKAYNDAKAIANKALYSLRPKSPSTGETKAKASSSYAEQRMNALRTKSWPVTLKLITEFRDIVEKNGSKFILIHGRNLTAGNTGGYTNQDFINFLKRNEISYILAYDIYEEIRFHRPKEENLFFEDSHPRAAGNDILGHHIADNLASYFQQTKRTPQNEK